MDYPASEAALARLADDPRFAERFELYACGVELANGFGELTDAAEQRRRFEAEMAERRRIYGEFYPIDEDFLAALAIMPDASGIALGFDRLVMLATGATHIEQVLWTPVAKAGTALPVSHSNKRRDAGAYVLRWQGRPYRRHLAANASDTRSHAAHDFMEGAMGLDYSLRSIVAIALTIATAASAQQGQSPAAPPVEPVATFDDKLVKIGEQAPGLGGMYFDDKGVLQVYMKNAVELRGAEAMKAARSQVTSAIASVLGAEFLTQNAAAKGRAQEPNIIEGDYDVVGTRRMEEKLQPGARRPGDRLRRSRRTRAIA